MPEFSRSIETDVLRVLADADTDHWAPLSMMELHADVRASNGRGLQAADVRVVLHELEVSGLVARVAPTTTRPAASYRLTDEGRREAKARGVLT